MNRPALTFACELPSESLVALLAQPGIIGDLRSLDASVSLALIDLSDERAAVVRLLRESQIPVIAWLLLPEAEGYWFHAAAAKAAQIRYAQFQAWSRQHGLEWSGLGIDLEPDIRDLRALLGPSAFKHFPRFLVRAWRRQAYEEATLEYEDLVARMRADGHLVETYRLPMAFDERRAGSSLVSRLLGIVEVAADRDVAMLYSSFERKLGPASIEAYGPEAQAIGIGSTGGGVDLPGSERFPPLSWDELERDLMLALTLRREIFIFSLEGCVERGYLRRLTMFPWSETSYPAAKPSLAATRRLRRLRRGLAAVLWIDRHWRLLLALLIGPVLLAWLATKVLP